MNIKKYRGILVSAVLLLLMMVIIFIFSMQNVKTSDSLSKYFAKAVVEIYKKLARFLPIGNSDVPWTDTGYSLLEDINHYIRKLAHVTEFAIMGSLAMFHMKEVGRLKNRTIGLRGIILSYVISTFYAATDEFHQLFVDGRGAKLKDVFIDSVGAIIGIMLTFAIFFFIKKRSCDTIDRNYPSGD